MELGLQYLYHSKGHALLFSFQWEQIGAWSKTCNYISKHNKFSNRINYMNMQAFS